jgi:hypothetical protein
MTQEHKSMGTTARKPMQYMHQRFEVLGRRLEKIMKGNSHMRTCTPPPGVSLLFTKQQQQQQPAVHLEDFSNFDFNCDFEHRFSGAGNGKIIFTCALLLLLVFLLIWYLPDNNNISNLVCISKTSPILTLTVTMNICFLLFLAMGTIVNGMS